MTAGHRHRVLHLKPHGVLLYLLQTPLTRSADYERVRQSRFTWGPEGAERYAGDGPVRVAQVWRLTPLGVLHGLIGLTVCTTRTAEPHEHGGGT